MFQETHTSKDVERDPFCLARRLRTPVWVYDTDLHKIAYANTAACKLWGAEDEASLTARDLSEGMSSTVADRLRQYQTDFISQNMQFSETWTIHPHGNPLSLDMVYSGYIMPDARMAMLCEVVGEADQTTENLRSTKALLHTDVIIALFSTNGKPLYKNPAAWNALPGADTTLENYFWTPEDYNLIQASWQAHGDSRNITRLKTSYGERWFDISIKQCSDSGSGEQALLVTAFDVSELKTIKAKSDIFQEQLEATFSASLDGILIIDSEGAILEFNESSQRIFGYNKESILGQNFAKTVIPKAMRQPYRAKLTSFQEPDKSNASGERIEIIAVRADGEPFICEMAISPSRSSNGDIFIIYIRDISQAKAAEKSLLEAKEAAEAASTAKSEFLANMSHEIRTPMNGVLGMIDVLNLTELTDKQKQCTDIINKSGHHLVTIISDILDFSKLEAGKVSINLAPCDLKNAVENSVNLLSARAAEKQIDLIYEYDPYFPKEFVADHNRIQQVVSNLIGNAIKFTHHGKIEVTVSGTFENEIAQVDIKVVDTGIGIDANKLDLIFEKFTQAEGSTTREYGGTGLGLSISRSLAEAMGGKLTVSSISGQGSTFTLNLSLKIMDLQRTVIPPLKKITPKDSPQRPAAKTATGKKLNFLIVEDDDINRTVLSHLLDDPRINIAFAENGLLAVQACKTAKYDMIFMDVSMPVMDGIEATNSIRAHEKSMGYEHTPIICLTARAMSGDKENFLEAGMDDYLSKPLQKDKLFRVLKKWLKPARRETTLPKRAHIRLG